MLHRGMNKDKMKESRKKEAFRTGKRSTEKIEQGRRERVRYLTFSLFIHLIENYNTFICSM